MIHHTLIRISALFSFLRDTHLGTVWYAPPLFTYTAVVLGEESANFINRPISTYFTNRREESANFTSRPIATYLNH